MENRHGLKILDPNGKTRRGVERKRDQHREYALYHALKRARQRFGMRFGMPRLRKLNRHLKSRRPMFVLGENKFYLFEGVCFVYSTHLRGVVTALPRERILELFYREICG